MNAITPEQQQAFDKYRAALSKVRPEIRVHDRMETFKTIRAICDRLEDWGKAYEDEARLALAYALDDVLDVDPEQIAELEDACGINHEIGHVYCSRRDALKRQWGIC